MFCPIRVGRMLVGWVSWAGTAGPTDLVYVMFFSIGWSLHPVVSAGKAVDYFSISLSSLLVTAKTSI